MRDNEIRLLVRMLKLLPCGLAHAKLIEQAGYDLTTKGAS